MWYCFLDLIAVAEHAALVVVGLQTPISTEDHAACPVAEYSKAGIH
jgi:hypothetical protein